MNEIVGNATCGHTVYFIFLVRCECIVNGIHGIAKAIRICGSLLSILFVSFQCCGFCLLCAVNMLHVFVITIRGKRIGAVVSRHVWRVGCTIFILGDGERRQNKRKSNDSDYGEVIQAAIGLGVYVLVSIVLLAGTRCLSSSNQRRLPFLSAAFCGAAIYFGREQFEAKASYDLEGALMPCAALLGALCVTIVSSVKDDIRRMDDPSYASMVGTTCA